MKLTNRYAMFVVVAVLFTFAVSIFSIRAAAQDDGWQIVRADYGSRNQRTDVTDILKDLISRGGVNGRVAVNNQTMGGDPAVGADKSLRIFARNRRNEEREFNFKEGGFVEARMFAFRREDRDDRPANANYGGRERDQDDNNGLRITCAYYGVQGRTVNVTELLRSRVRDGSVSFVVSNSALGGDPAVGADKVLIVVYRYRGSETAAAVPEGIPLSLP
ncbi:MAG TPA: DUF3395 domain-containing protein [Candidatus Acidoferrum sp.]|jgi:hypothetical protein|nr:DUF3395 domain-containing protein [Candidatus Acidoferrum sp.]